MVAMTAPVFCFSWECIARQKPALCAPDDRLRQSPALLLGAPSRNPAEDPKTESSGAPNDIFNRARSGFATKELSMQDVSSQKTVLLIGASRGLGFAMVEEYLKRGWRVIATGREDSTDKLRRLSENTGGALEVET